jgi:hypothetical protein
MFSVHAGEYVNVEFAGFRVAEGKTMEKHEDELSTALRSLRNQNISVSSGILGPNGLVFDVMGIMLTGRQILRLKQVGRLNAEGVEKFAKSVEGDPNAATAMP